MFLFKNYGIKLLTVLKCIKLGKWELIIKLYMMHMLFRMLYFKGMSNLEVTLPSENAQTFLFIFAFLSPGTQMYLDTLLLQGL